MTEQQQTFEQNPKQPLEELYEWVESAVFTISIMLLILTLVVRQVTVYGSSMVPTLHEADWLLMQQIGYREPQYGDIVVIDTPQLEEPTIIKRVIGREGDTIDIDFNTHEVRRNGELLTEPYINEPTELSYDIEFPVTVPPGHLFVLGDNRNASSDSRSSSIGMVDVRRVMGKAWMRFLPFDQMGGLYP